MPNKNYVKGRRKEYAIIKELRETCEVAFRSAGSHSPVDCIGIDTKRNTIWLIQAKPDSLSQRARKALEEDNKELNGTFEVRFLVI